MNSNGFTAINPPVKEISNTRSQDVLYNQLIPGRISEFLHRVKTRLLNKDIMSELRKHNSLTGIRIHSQIKNVSRLISVYIYFIKDDYRYAHITFHLGEADFSKYSPGPIHLTLTPDKDTEDKIIKDIKHVIIHTKKDDTNSDKYNDGRMKYVMTGKPATLIKYMDNHPEYTIALNVLQTYFDMDSNRHLGTILSGKTIRHPNTKHIINSRRSATNPVISVKRIPGKSFKFRRVRPVQDGYRPKTFTYKKKKSLIVNKSEGIPLQNANFNKISNTPKVFKSRYSIINKTR